MNKPIKVLIVEDSEDDAKLALRALRRGGFEPASRRVQTAADLETALAEGGWDAVISDYAGLHRHGCAQDFPFHRARHTVP